MDDHTQDERVSGKGISLDRVYTVLAAVIAVLSVLLFLSTRNTNSGYTRTREATEQFITAQQAASDMQAASDYLTAQARTFVVTGEMEHAELFFEETDVTRRRDRALEAIGELADNPSTYAFLSDAKDKSDALLEIELYAMRLAGESRGFAPGEYPARLSEVTLSGADLNLTPEEQRSKALNMLFDDTYQAHKDEIRKNVSQSVDLLIEETHSRQTESSSMLLRLIRREELLIGVLLILAVAMVLLTALMVTGPLRDFVNHIHRGEMLPEKGAGELRFLARTYNRALEKNLSRQQQLSYDATHDALTGVFNRSVFEKLRSRINERETALLIVDLDKFKMINDTYGHDAGDRALCWVSALLQQNFRAEDYVCRIGGDEFTVIMVNANSGMRDLVEEKIHRINELLKQPEEGLPPLSLSVGVAFGDREDPTDDIYKDADTALYRTKSARLGGVEFY